MGGHPTPNATMRSVETEAKAANIEAAPLDTTLDALMQSVPHHGPWSSWVDGSPEVPQVRPPASPASLRRPQPHAGPEPVALPSLDTSTSVRTASRSPPRTVTARTKLTLGSILEPERAASFSPGGESRGSSRSPSPSSGGA